MGAATFIVTERWIKLCSVSKRPCADWPKHLVLCECKFAASFRQEWGRPLSSANKLTFYPPGVQIRAVPSARLLPPFLMLTRWRATWQRCTSWASSIWRWRQHLFILLAYSRSLWGLRRYSHVHTCSRLKLPGYLSWSAGVGSGRVEPDSKWQIRFINLL